MIDNRTTELTATDRLRELLDERGVEYETDERNAITEWSTYYGAFVYFARQREGKLLVETTVATKHSVILTPEQAIAATLGRGTLTAGQVSKATYAHSIHADCADADWQAIADELNAALGSNTCHMSFVDEYETASGEEEYLCECSECGYRRWEPAHDLPLYCRKCGKAVKR